MMKDIQEDIREKRPLILCLLVLRLLKRIYYQKFMDSDQFSVYRSWQ